MVVVVTGRVRRGIHKHVELRFSPSIVGTWLEGYVGLV